MTRSLTLYKKNEMHTECLCSLTGLNQIICASIPLGSQLIHRKQLASFKMAEQIGGDSAYEVTKPSELESAVSFLNDRL